MSSPYGPPSPYDAPQRTETKAVVALALSVAAWLPIIPFVGAIAGLVVAGMAKRDILASGGRLGGLGLVSAARVIAWVHLLFVLVLFVVIVLAVLGVFAFTLFGVTVGST